ncbi:hypothetical protein ARMGADRAFT_1034529 [Armillaria gallica]|uniref:Uncharacterized protein n=1 Tax=Armillaria gallica TaxID=47427 RepID=A0A2H3D0J6_ARMGA|nr:hypothetical protein ARMGADRAFT_1034529 [Armillaria gallica]
MSAPVWPPATSVHSSKCKHSQCLSTWVVSPMSVLASHIGPLYTQAVYTKVGNKVSPIKKVCSYCLTHVVSVGSADRHLSGALPTPVCAAVHELPAVSISELGPNKVSALEESRSLRPSSFESVGVPQPVMIDYPVDGATHTSSDCSNASTDESSKSGYESGEGSQSGESYNNMLNDVAGTVSVPDIAGSAVAVPVEHVQHVKIKTEHGQYVDTMIQNSLAQHVAGSGHARDDTSVSVFVSLSLSVAPLSVPVVYLEDLDGPPLPGSPKK